MKSAWALSFLLLVAASLFLRASWVSDYSRKKLDFVEANHERVFNLFQTTFYFSYEDQFKPSIEDFLKRSPDLKRVLVISNSGEVAFDSDDLSRSKMNPYEVHPSLKASLGKKSLKPEVVSDHQGVGVLVSTGLYSVYYVFSTAALTLKSIFAFLIGSAFMLLFGAILVFFRSPLSKKWVKRLKSSFRARGLRLKFIAAIVLVNVTTGAIVFFSQSRAQKNEQSQSLIQNSVLIAELGKDSIVAAFSSFFNFHYAEKFVPAMKQLMKTKENLTQIRIISSKSDMVVFDSEDMLAGRQPIPGVEGKRSGLSDIIVAELQKRDTFWQAITPPGGDPYIQVVSTYRNENQEALFYVEYIFSFASLKERVRIVQRQILTDLIPSILIGILVAILFSQLVTGPIRSLVGATKAITGGNYDVSLRTDRDDELGELMRSFNAMSTELKRKSELKKYLSDYSYRKIVEAPEGGSEIRGSRVRATVLFCDIRDFVATCETLDAEEVTSMLNEYFSSMVEVIYKHKGEVDKFIGDAILAIFYEQEDSKSQVNTALHAIYCAMEMRERLVDYNAKRLRSQKAPIEIGIGIDSGEIISGPIGSPDRMDFTVIGDVVNLANRIEKLSKQGKHTRIVFSHHVEGRVKGLLDYEELSRDRIKGKNTEVVVYELVKIKDVRALLTGLNHADHEVKRHCIELLGYSRNPGVLPEIFEKLSDVSEPIRIAAITAITRLAPKNHPEALKALFSQLDHEDSQRAISTIIIGLGKLCGSSEILRIVKFLHHKDERIVANAIEAIGSYEDDRVVDLLMPFVASKSNRIKANAAMALFSKGKIEIIDAVKPMLLHSDHLMRASAAFAVGELAIKATASSITSVLKNDGSRIKYFLAELQGCVPLLVSLLKDRELVVKRQAVIALGKIKDKSAVLALLDNLDLENDSKELVQEVADALRSIGSHRLVREVVKQFS